MISKQEALDIAVKECQRRGWIPKTHMDAQIRREYVLWGRKYWYVITNTRAIGGNTFIHVEADSGEIIKVVVLPR